MVSVRVQCSIGITASTSFSYLFILSFEQKEINRWYVCLRRWTTLAEYIKKKTITGVTKWCLVIVRKQTAWTSAENHWISRYSNLCIHFYAQVGRAHDCNTVGLSFSQWACHSKIKGLVSYSVWSVMSGNDTQTTYSIRSSWDYSLRLTGRHNQGTNSLLDV